MGSSFGELMPKFSSITILHYAIANNIASVLIFMFSYSVSTLRFNHSTYSVNESDGKVNITLYHSNPSSIDIVLRVNSSDVSADGKLMML